MTSNPFRASQRVPLWLPPAIFGAVALAVCAWLASGETPFMDLRPLMYVAIAVLWAGASSVWFLVSGFGRTGRGRQTPLEAHSPVARVSTPPSSLRVPSTRPARSRAARFGLGLYVTLSFALFLVLPVIDRRVAARQVDGDTMRTVQVFEAAAVLNLLAASLAFARARR